MNCSYWKTTMNSEIMNQLKNGDMRTKGKSEEVVVYVLKHPKQVDELFSGLLTHDAGLRMRCSDVLAKIAHHNPALIQPHKQYLIDTLSTIDQQEVQWHVAEIFSVIELDSKDQEKVVIILLHFLETTKSNIVKVFSLQALADIAERNSIHKFNVMQLIKNEMEKGTPSIVSRGKRLLKQLEKI